MLHLTLHQQDCLQLLPTIPASSVGAVICDPPYGLSFQGVAWDTIDGGHVSRKHVLRGAIGDKMGRVCNPHNATEQAELRGKHNNAFFDFSCLWLVECYRVLRPGGVIKAFAATRTMHRLAAAMEAVGLEEVGFEVWSYGNGFPKSMNIGAAIDKAERGCPQGTPDPQKRGGQVVPNRATFALGGGSGKAPTGLTSDYKERVFSSVVAQQWSHWGTLLKPAWEPFVLARKPVQ